MKKHEINSDKFFTLMNSDSRGGGAFNRFTQEFRGL